MLFPKKVTQKPPSVLYIIQDLDLKKLMILRKPEIVQFFSNFLKRTWDFLFRPVLLTVLSGHIWSCSHGYFFFVSSSYSKCYL